MSQRTVPYAAGDLLREILAARSLTQAWLADRMGRPAQVVSEIATGKKRITAATAVGLEAALSVPAEVWLTVQAVHSLHGEQTNRSDASLTKGDPS